MPLNLKREDLEKLVAKGLIKQETIDGLPRFAAGGVVKPLVPDYSKPIDLTDLNADIASRGTVDSNQMPNISNGFAGIEDTRGGRALSSLNDFVQGAVGGEKFKAEKEAIAASEPQSSGQMAGELAQAPALEPMVEGFESSPSQTQATPQPPTDSTFGLFEKAIRANMDASKQEAQATVDAITQSQDVIAKQAEVEERLNAERALKLDAAQQKVDMAVQEYATAKINPDRIWANKTTGNKLGMAISLFFAGINGSQAGLQIINNAIDRDIDAQKADLAASRGRYDLQRGMLADMMTRFQDDRQAAAAAKLTQLNLVELSLKKQLALVQGTKSYAKGLEGLGKLQQMKAQAMQKFNLATLASNGFQSEMGFQRTYMSLPKDYQEKAVRLPGDKLGIALNKESAKDVTEKLPAFDGVIGKIKELQKISSLRVIPSEQKGKAESLAKQITLAVKNLEKTGALDQGTIDITDAIIGDPNTLWQGRQKGRLESYLNSLQTDRERFLGQNIVNYRPLDIRAK